MTVWIYIEQIQEKYLFVIKKKMSVYEHNEKKDPDWWMIVRNSIGFIECENEISVETID